MKSLCNGLLGSAVFAAFLFQLPIGANAQTQHKVVYSFCAQVNCPDGAGPSASLIDVNGKLYGTTYSGGSGGSGTVFSFDPGTGIETVLHSFIGYPSDGASPSVGTSLIDVKGLLYGTTLYGGSQNNGTVFSVDPGTGAETVLYSFCSQVNCTAGGNPDWGLIDVNGTLYGATLENGSNGRGTLFSFDPGTGALTVLYSFCSQANCADGAFPGAVIDVNGTLYGTTSEGGGTGCGGSGCGAVFSFDPGTDTEKVLYAFQGGTGDGSVPSGSSLLDIDGTLYGTTIEGGGTGCKSYHQRVGDGCGTVFSLDPSTGVEGMLYAFCGQPECTDGAKPFRGMIDVNGILYGPTYIGGAHIRRGGAGTVFSFDPSTGTETVIYSFCSRGSHCRDGENPDAGLLQAKDKLYGTTAYGGAYGSGTLFWLKTN